MATQFLRDQGLRIVHKNFHCRGGEIDIIAVDHEHLVFVEVRYRDSNQFGSAVETVTPRKQKRVILAARNYLHKNRIDQPCRFDVIGIDSQNQTEWIKDAFQT